MPARTRPALAIVDETATPQTTPTHVPWETNTRVKLELGRPKSAHVFALVDEELDDDGRRVFVSTIRGRLSYRAQALPELSLSLLHSIGSHAPLDKTHLSLTSDGVSLMELAAFGAALQALVADVIAQGGNDTAWHELTGFQAQVVDLDPRAMETPR
jgi:hypothetical protein